MARRKSPAFDSQREEVYKWEQSFNASWVNTAPPKLFDKTIREFCEWYGVKAPKVLRTMPPKWKLYAGVSDQRNGKLYFDKNYASIMVLCHEMAHWIMDDYGYGDWGAHGPRWLGLYMYLLVSAHVMPMTVLKFAVSEAGLKYRDPIKECGPGKLKRYLKKL